MGHVQRNNDNVEDVYRDSCIACLRILHDDAYHRAFIDNDE